MSLNKWTGFSQPAASKLGLNRGKCSGAGIEPDGLLRQEVRRPAIDEAVCQEIGGPEAPRQSRASL